MTLIFYAASTFAPLIYGDCPSNTTLLRVLYAVTVQIAKSLRLSDLGTPPFHEDSILPKDTQWERARDLDARLFSAMLDSFPAPAEIRATIVAFTNFRQLQGRIGHVYHSWTSAATHGRTPEPPAAALSYTQLTLDELHLQVGMFRRLSVPHLAAAFCELSSAIARVPAALPRQELSIILARGLWRTIRSQTGRNMKQQWEPQPEN
jgi:hypothetical protein